MNYKKTDIFASTLESYRERILETIDKTTSDAPRFMIDMLKDNIRKDIDGCDIRLMWFRESREDEGHWEFRLHNTKIPSFEVIYFFNDNDIRGDIWTVNYLKRV